MKVKEREIKKVWIWARTPQGYWQPAAGDVIQFTRAMLNDWRYDSYWLVNGHPAGTYFMNAMRYW